MAFEELQGWDMMRGERFKWQMKHLKSFGWWVMAYGLVDEGEWLKSEGDKVYEVGVGDTNTSRWKFWEADQPIRKHRINNTNELKFNLNLQINTVL